MSSSDRSNPQNCHSICVVTFDTEENCKKNKIFWTNIKAVKNYPELALIELMALKGSGK